ncbi:hypothetical protein LPJ59_007101, partial [Coemansia sp. RSA 2399]
MLAQLLVNWSFCEEHLLGYDTTVTHNAELDCWEIQVPANTADNQKDTTGESSSPSVFYSKEMVFNSDRLFGRHNRCFLATKVKPDRANPIKTTGDEDIFNVPSEEVPLNVPTCEFIIKDAWPEVDRDPANDSRDEIVHLLRIKEKLENDGQLYNMYPRIDSGGCVQFVHGPDNTEYAYDTTKTILGGVSGDGINDIPVRVHKRIAMTPVGRPLRWLSSVYELVI